MQTVMGESDNSMSFKATAKFFIQVSHFVVAEVVEAIYLQRCRTLTTIVLLRQKANNL